LTDSLRKFGNSGFRALHPFSYRIIVRKSSPKEHNREPIAEVDAVVSSRSFFLPPGAVKEARRGFEL